MIEGRFVDAELAGGGEAVEVAVFQGMENGLRFGRTAGGSDIRNV